MSIFIVAGLTFQEARRKKLVWVALGLGAAFLALFALGLHFILQEITESSPRSGMTDAALRVELTQASGLLLIMGLFVINFLIVMMTALTSTGTLSGEITSHTIQTIATKPLPRRNIIIGKWLGHGLMVVLYIAFMFSGLTLVTYIMSGYTPPNFWAGLALLILEGLIVLSLAIFGGTFLSTLANGVLVFMLYGLAFIGSWVEQIGAAMESETAVQVGIIASLIMPSETMWRMVSELLQPPLLSGLGFTPFTIFSKPSNAMVIYAIIYMAALLAGALYQFDRRDL
jgi:Cu-processing system permease protein